MTGFWTSLIVSHSCNNTVSGPVPVIGRGWIQQKELFLNHLKTA